MHAISIQQTENGERRRKRTFDLVNVIERTCDYIRARPPALRVALDEDGAVRIRPYVANPADEIVFLDDHSEDFVIYDRFLRVLTKLTDAAVLWEGHTFVVRSDALTNLRIQCALYAAFRRRDWQAERSRVALKEKPLETLKRLIGLEEQRRASIVEKGWDEISQIPMETIQRAMRQKRIADFNRDERELEALIEAEGWDLPEPSPAPPLPTQEERKPIASDIVEVSSLDELWDDAPTSEQVPELPVTRPMTPEEVDDAWAA